MAELVKKKHELTILEKAALILAIASSALAFLFPFLAFDLKFIAQITYLPAVLFGLRSMRRTKYFGKSLPVIACVALAVIGIAWTPASERGRAMIIAVHLASVIPLAALIVDKKCIRFCATTYVTASATAVIVSVYMMVSKLGINGLQKFGALINEKGNVVTNQNELGASVGLATLLAIALAIGYLKECSKENKQLHIKLIYFNVIAIILALAVTLTGSRGAFIATLIGAFILLLSKGSGLSRAKVLTAALILIIVPGIIISMVTGISPIDRLTNRFSEDTVGDFSGRLPIWQNTLDAIGERSFYVIYGTGTGGADKLIGSFDKLSRRGKDGIYRRSAHSSYVEWFTYFGILGLIPGAVLIWSIVRRAIKLDKISHSKDRIAFLTFFLIFSFDGVVFRASYWPMLGSVLLVVLSYSSLADYSSPIFGQSDAKSKNKYKYAA